MKQHFISHSFLPNRERNAGAAPSDARHSSAQLAGSPSGTCLLSNGPCPRHTVWSARRGPGRAPPHEPRSVRQQQTHFQVKWNRGFHPPGPHTQTPGARGRPRV